MTNLKYFHGQIDANRLFLGHWETVKRERKYSHSVQYSRQVLYHFGLHLHPYAERLMGELVTKDVDGLLALNLDTSLRVSDFASRYTPSGVIAAPDADLVAGHPVAIYATPKPPTPTEPADSGLPARELDFDYQYGAYSVYNWELFFHVPFLIACHLSANGRYVDAQTWFHRIFDPTDDSDPALGPQRFWRFRPFKVNEVQHLEEMFEALASGSDPQLQRTLVAAIEAWRDHPLRPHLVARTRPTAYMYATVMAYLRNLRDWGDALFRQDDRESINEATQLYVLAADIVGLYSEVIPRVEDAKPMSYEQLRHDLDALSNATVAMEPEMGFDLYPPPASSGEPSPAHAAIETIGHGTYFCLPRNDEVDEFRAMLADRFWKIHTSRNIDGVFRQLPLFPPPIDPAMLARAVAAGVDIAAIIDGSALGEAPVRFAVLLQKALELASEVKAFGSQLLAAIEKKDNETLTVLRAKHERSVAEFNENLKFAQWQDAVKAREGVWQNIQNTFQRLRHYDRLLGTDDSTIKLPDYPALDTSRLDDRKPLADDEPVIGAADPSIRIGSSFRDGGHKISPEEAHEIDLEEASQILQDVATGLDAAGAVLNIIPTMHAAVHPMGVGADVGFGGQNVAALMRDLAAVSRGVAGRVNHEAMLAGKMGSFARREQDWALQRKAAAGELTQLYKQYRGAEIREHIAKSDHANAVKQVGFAADILEFLTNEKNSRTGQDRKTTTDGFYLWMKRELQSLHARTFDLAQDLAKQAERVAKRELPQLTDTFIGSSYLTGLERLLAGDKLYLDLKRLELAYLDANTREFELTKHVSLKEWFPVELLDLRTNGACHISLPEALFDLDCPGHSMRRIRSVAVSIPCVVGPYASVNCSLTLGSNYVRIGKDRYYKTGAVAGQDYDPSNDTTNFLAHRAAVNSIVTSGAQSDSGLFEVNLRDERVLPFEYCGAISSWDLELIGQPPAFDYGSIADVVLTIRYTARADGNTEDAVNGAADWLKEHAVRSFSMRHEFATEWAAFKLPEPNTPSTLAFTLDEGHYPYRTNGLMGHTRRVHLFFGGDPGGDVTLKRAGIIVATFQGAKSGVSVDAQFDRSGKFELEFPSNAIDNLWVVVDWAIASK